MSRLMGLVWVWYAECEGERQRGAVCVCHGMYGCVRVSVRETQCVCVMACMDVLGSASERRSVCVSWHVWVC